MNNVQQEVVTWEIHQIRSSGIRHACLYNGYGNTVNEIPENELSVSLFREVYPEKLFLTLCEQGHRIKERYPGIYYVTGNLPFPVQIVVTKQLKREKHRRRSYWRN